MVEQRIKYKVLTYRYSTGKMDMGPVDKGYKFTPVAEENGYYAITPRKWVDVSACEPTTATPPPVEPPSEIMHQRTSFDGGLTWVNDKYYRPE